MSDSFNGSALEVNRCVKLDNAEVITKTDGGIPLLVKYKFGEGIVYFINAKEYPADKAVEPVYRYVITLLSDSLNKEENSFIECDERVQFAVYEQDDNSRNIYVTAVDWYKDPSEIRKAELVLNGKKYPVEMPFGVMFKIVINGNIAAWTDTESSEVLCVNENEIKVQGCGDAMLYTVKNDSLNCRKLTFADNAVITLNI